MPHEPEAPEPGEPLDWTLYEVARQEWEDHLANEDDSRHDLWAADWAADWTDQWAADLDRDRI